MKTTLHAARLALARPYTSIAFHLMYRGLQASSFGVRNKVDFHALDAKWKAKWAAKESEHDKNKCCKALFRPLAPLRFSMMGIRKPQGDNEKYQVDASATESGDIFSRRFPFATPEESDEFLKLRARNQHIQRCVLEVGLDLVRTCIVFGAQGDLSPQCNTARILQIRQWFESVWEAISIAHVSYCSTQAAYSDPNIPDPLYEPNIDAWVDHIGDETRCLVHDPPHEPRTSDHNDSDEDGDRVWLAAQEALISFTKCSDANHNAQIIKRLTTLTAEIIKYYSTFKVFSHVQYHAARILISLITSFAPSFAEECWVLLHYGSSSLLGVHSSAVLEEGEVDDDEDRETPSLEQIESILAEDEEEWEESYTHLPRRWYPETLPSLFEISPPMPASTEAVRLLRQRVDARTTRCEKSHGE